MGNQLIGNIQMFKNRNKIMFAYRCVRNLGVLAGLRFLKAANNKQKELHLLVPGLENRIIARGGTSDIQLIEKIFFIKEYPLFIGFKPKTIVDAGANVGYATLFYHMAYRDAQILSIEPEASNFRLLKSNLKPYTGLIPLFGGLWSHKTVLSISNPEGPKYSFQVQETRCVENNIPAYGIEDILRMQGWDQLDILKIDIEGAEKQLFAENYENWLPKVHYIIIELHEHYAPGCSRTLFNSLKDFDYQVFLRGENIIIKLNRYS